MPEYAFALIKSRFSHRSKPYYDLKTSRNGKPHHYGIFVFLPFSVRHQKLVVELPSLYSPERSEGDGWCWTNLQNTHFSGLTRKRRDFERSVLKYVSIKIPALTHSGRKMRVCVNTADRLSPRRKALPSSAFPAQRANVFPKSCLHRLCQRDSRAQGPFPAHHVA